MIMNKTAACYLFDSFQDELHLVLNKLGSDDVELLKENSIGLSTTISCYSFDGENIFSELFQTLQNDDCYFDNDFRLRVDLLIEKCRSLADALGNTAMLLELMKSYYPKEEKEVGAIGVQTSA